MDVLSDVLLAVRLTGAIFFDVEARSPFAAETPAVEAIARRVMAGAGHVISFHIVTEGACWAEAIGLPDRPVHLRAGEIVVYPMGDPNVLASAPGMRGTPDETLYYHPTDRLLPFPLKVNDNAGADTCRFVCGFLGCDSRPFNPLLSALPRIVHAPVSSLSRGWLASIVDAAVKESAHGSAGREAMLAKLAELMFVEVMRNHIDSLPGDARGWFAGLAGSADWRGPSPDPRAAIGAVDARQSGARNRAVAIGLRRTVHHLCADAADAISRAMAPADCRPASRSPKRQHRAGGGRSRISVGSGVQPRLQKICRLGARSVAPRACGIGGSCLGNALTLAGHCEAAAAPDRRRYAPHPAATGWSRSRGSGGNARAIASAPNPTMAEPIKSQA